jgi:hypothetical protein
MQTTLSWVDIEADLQEKPGHIVTIVTYGQRRFFMMFLDMDRVRDLFEQRMSGRQPYEIADEGWDGEAIDLPLVNNEGWFSAQGALQEQMRDFSNDLLKALFGANQ